MTTLPRDFTSQVTFFDDLKAQLNAMELAAQPVFLNQSTEPTQAQWEAGWVSLGGTLPIDTRAELYWYDGTQMRGIYGTIDDWVTPMLAPKWHFQQDPTLSGAMPLGSAAFIDESSYVFLYQDITLGSTTVLLGKVVQGVFSQITTGAAVVSNASPIRVNPAGTKVAFRDTAGNLRTINMDGTGLTTIVATVCSQIGDWKSNKILYVDSSNVIKYIDDNGTNNTTVISKFGSVIRGLRFNSALTRIYYSISSEIRSCTLAGASDQLESYAGSFTIVDTYNDERIVFKDDLSVVVGGVSYSVPVYKVATITDIKNTAKEFSNPIDFRDQLSETESTSPGAQTDVASGTYEQRPVSLTVPPYSPMNQFYRPSNFYDRRYAQNTVHDISPNDSKILLSTGFGEGFYVGANRDEGYESTGKVYRLNSWEAPTPDFAKLGSFSFSPANNIITFTIPQTYTHLLIEGALISSGVANFGLVRFNGDSTATNYMSTVISNALSQTKTEYLAKQGIYVGWAGTVLTPFRFYIVNYRGTHIKQTSSNVGVSGATGNYRISGAWNSTAAITTISFVLEGGLAFGATSTADVYGYQGQGRYW